MNLVFKSKLSREIDKTQSGNSFLRHPVVCLAWLRPCARLNANTNSMSAHTFFAIIDFRANMFREQFRIET